MSKTFRIADGDWVIDQRSGRPELIVDGPKLSQDLRELLTIETLPSGFGAGIEELVGVVADPFTVQTLIDQRIQDAVSAMQRLQDQFIRSERPASERIRQVARLAVYPVSVGGGPLSTGYAFELSVQTFDGAASSSGGVVI